MPPGADDELIKSLKQVSLKDISEDKLKSTAIDFQAFIDAAKSANDGLMASKQLTPGTIIAHKYEISELISSGGMGSIYKAMHRQLGKPVAIKVLLVDKLVKDVTYKRFEREAKTAGGLNHPNIVSVYDYGIIGNDRPYIVMELLEGINLDNLLVEHGYLAPYLVLEILKQTCEALSHAHSRGLVHRDLKPSNIMLMADDRGKPLIKIIDFGIAKFSNNKKPETKPITKPGQIFGSPLYMSPEQCIGQELDARADIYSLGCVIYEMFCGEPPFIGDTLLSTIYKHVNEPAPPFKEVTQRAVPGELEAIVLKMLAKDPTDRFQTADEVLVALEKVYKAQEKPNRILDKHKPFISKLFLRFPWLKTVGAILVPVAIAIGFKAALDMNHAQNHNQPTNQSFSHQGFSRQVSSKPGKFLSKAHLLHR